MTVTEWIRAIRGSPQVRHLAIVKRPFQGAYPRKRSTPTMCLHESAKFLCHRGGSWGIPYLFRHDFCRSQVSGSGNPPPHCRYEAIHIGRICPGKGLLPTLRKRLFRPHFVLHRSVPPQDGTDASWQCAAERRETLPRKKEHLPDIYTHSSPA